MLMLILELYQVPVLGIYFKQKDSNGGNLESIATHASAAFALECIGNLMDELIWPIRSRNNQ